MWRNRGAPASSPAGRRPVAPEGVSWSRSGLRGGLGGARGVGTHARGHHVQVSSSTVGQPHPAPAQNPGRLGAEEPLVVVDAYVAGGPVGAGRIGVVAGAIAAAGAGGAGRPSGERHAEEESGEDLGEPSAGEAGAENTGEDVEARGVHRGFLLATDGRTVEAVGLTRTRRESSEKAAWHSPPRADQRKGSEGLP